MSGHVFVVAGPTAVGKGTVLAQVFDRDPEIAFSVSATTRPARPGEVDGVNYFFVSADEFDDLVARDEMLEWAWVHKKHRYGTPRKPVLEAIAEGTSVILEVDLDGARQVRRSLPDATHIFIAPPSFDALVDRLESRGTEDAEERERRLATAREEMAAIDEFDHVVVNDTVANATDEVLRIIHSHE